MTLKCRIPDSKIENLTSSSWKRKESYKDDGKDGLRSQYK